MNNILKMTIAAIRTGLSLGRVVFVLIFLGVFVASHTFSAFAAITSTAISAVSGVGSTVLGRSKSELKAKSKEIAQLNKKLSVEQRRVAGLRAQNVDLKAKNVKLLKDTAITFQGRTTTMKSATQDVLSASMARTKRASVANLSSVPAEAIPLYGIAFVLAATTYELKSACDTMKDLWDLQVAIDPETARPDDVTEVCAMRVPTKEEVWSSIKASPQTVWTASSAALVSVSDSAQSLEMPEFSGLWQRATNWLGGLF